MGHSGAQIEMSKGSTRVAEDVGEDVGGPEIGAKHEARDLSLGGVVAGLGSSVNKCGERVVAEGASPKAQQVAWANRINVGALGALVLVFLEQPDDGRRFKRLRARGCSSSPSPSSQVMTQTCPKDGEGRSCMASSVPGRTLCSVRWEGGDGAQGRRCARRIRP